MSHSERSERLSSASRRRVEWESRRCCSLFSFRILWILHFGRSPWRTSFTQNDSNEYAGCPRCAAFFAAHLGKKYRLQRESEILPHLPAQNAGRYGAPGGLVAAHFLFLWALRAVVASAAPRTPNYVDYATLLIYVLTIVSLLLRLAFERKEKDPSFASPTKA